ncbi:MAG TPA: hypothetical protein VI821_00390 [Candidatus Paceibacterota bacterium]
MSVSDVKQIMVDNRQSSVIELAPLSNTQNYCSMTLPKEKLLPKSFVGVKFEWGYFPMFDSIVILSIENSFIRAQPEGGTAIEIFTAGLNLIFPLPQANPTVLGPVNIASNADLAAMIQANLNAEITALGLDAQWGGINSITVTWVAAEVSATSNGFYVFRNVYSVPFRLDFAPTLTINKGMGILLGFGNGVTDYAVTHISHTATRTLPAGAVTPSDLIAHLYVVLDYVASGVDRGVLTFTGTQPISGIVAAIDLNNVTAATPRFYEEAFNTPALIVTNSVFYERTRSHDFRLPPYTPPLPAQLTMTSNPLMQLRFATSSGFAFDLTDDPVSIDIPQGISFAIMYDTNTPTSRIT